MYLANCVCKSAVELMKLINRLNERNEEFVMRETEGIDGEKLVIVEWNYVEDDEEEES